MNVDPSTLSIAGLTALVTGSVGYLLHGAVEVAKTTATAKLHSVERERDELLVTNKTLLDRLDLMDRTIKEYGDKVVELEGRVNETCRENDRLRAENTRLRNRQAAPA
jgi:predicted RNase H-like nuclease (RuvC/YqgF family)